MHEPLKANLERYLSGSAALPDVTAHLAACEACRAEVAQMESQAHMLHLLRAPDVEPFAGFYARVMERIDNQRPVSFWSALLEPAFGRRLAVASAAFALMMGVYLVGSEPNGQALYSKAPVYSSVFSTDSEPDALFNQTQEPDRGAVLASLVTFRQER